MIIGDRLRELREQKNLSQGDIEKRTGLLRCYISRVENGHTVPAIETLEKMARALEIPLYRLFYEGEFPAVAPDLPNAAKRENQLFGAGRKESRYLRKLSTALGKVDDAERSLLLFMAIKMARPRRVQRKK